MKKKNKVALIVASVLASAVSFGVVASLARGNDEEKEKVLTGWDYQVCRMDEDGVENGDDKSGIVTKEFYELEDLKSIKWAAEEDDLNYTVYVYRDDYQFLTIYEYAYDDPNFVAFEALEDNPEAKYFKIEVYTWDGESGDEEISFFEKFELAKGIEVTIQDGCNAEQFKDYLNSEGEE